MTSYAQQERRQLADLLAGLGPDAPTLCDGWTTRDLAAHIVVRERRPDASAGMVVKPLRAYGERVRLAKAAEPYETIVAELRRPPLWSPVSNPLTDEPLNSGEMFIHHEDCRRAVDGWQPRDLAPGHERALWQSAQFAARFRLRSLGVTLWLRSAGLGEFKVGSGPEVTLTGPAGELTMFLSGRREHARVEIGGSEDGVRRFREARLGI